MASPEPAQNPHPGSTVQLAEIDSGLSASVISIRWLAWTPSADEAAHGGARNGAQS